MILVYSNIPLYRVCLPPGDVSSIQATSMGALSLLRALTQCLLHPHPPRSYPHLKRWALALERSRVCSQPHSWSVTGLEVGKCCHFAPRLPSLLSQHSQCKSLAISPEKAHDGPTMCHVLSPPLLSIKTFLCGLAVGMCKGPQVLLLMHPL